ncbi:SIS domain-containing protein [Arthrobacter sedimenti]|uniref:SIS domain-containing protein n=1 Tax=Arthrobacter sedimenti TaxID=2694931 RepID=UPI000B361F1D|nr:SIS domain-containing protein [Arthrobacter sedimenti]OUM43470.1 hypothetical protein B8W73_06150 [Arthrobacter agilis]
MNAQQTLLPLRPIAPDLGFVLDDVLAQRTAITAFVREAPVRNVFLVACGGSLMDLYPAQFLLETKAGVPAFILNADEFNFREPTQLGEGSLVVCVSATGSSREVVAAAKAARKSGARVASVVKEGRTSLTLESSTAFTFSSSKMVSIVAAMQTLSLLIAQAVVEYTEPAGKHVETHIAYDALPNAIESALVECDEHLKNVAEALADEPIMFSLGGGPNYGAAYGFALCFVLEMQWKYGIPFNANEFLHGAMEVTTNDTPALLLIGEDATRPSAERTKAFLEAHTSRAHFIDTQELTLPGVPAGARGDVSALVLGALTVRLAEHYEATTGHHLDIRRYMFRVDY